MSARPLTKLQKSLIAQAARRAWDALTLDLRRQAIHQASEATNDPLCSDNQAFTHWRHAQQCAATGCDSLRAMTQRDYLPCLLHFQLIQGNHGQPTLDTVMPPEATRTLARNATEEHRRARWKLGQALREAGLEQAYAEKICRTQYKCPLADASTKQLWRLFFTIRNRRKSTHRTQPTAA